MAGIDLATAYVTILPSTRGLGATLNQQLVAPVGGAAKAAGGLMSKGIMGPMGKIGSALAAVGIASFLKGSVKAANAAEVSQTLLRNAVEQAGGSWAAYGGKLDTVIQKQSMLAAVDDEDLGDALRSLIQATGDVDKATGLLGLTTDLARAKNMDLATASKLIGKVAMGNVSILTRYGIVLEKGATATDALAAIQKKFGGAAEAYGKTTAGALDRAKVSIENLQETVGSTLLPTIGKFADAGTKALAAFDKWPPAAKDAAIGVGAVGAAALVVTPWIVSFAKAVGVANFAVGGLVAAGAVANYFVAKQVNGWAQSTVKLLGLTEAQDSANAAILRSLPLLRFAADLQHGAGYSARILGEATTEASGATSAAKQVTDAMAAAQGAMADEVNGATKAWRAETLSMLDSRNAHESALGNVIAAKDAAKALASARKSGNPAEIALAEMKLKDAQDLAAQTADNLTKKQVQQAIKMGVLKGKVSDYITTVHKVPKKVTTEIDVDVNDTPLRRLIKTLKANGLHLGGGAIRFEVTTGVGGGALGGIIRPQALGDIIPSAGRGTIVEVAENGYAETLLNWAPSNLRRNAALMNATAAGIGLAQAAPARGGDTYITVNADSMSDHRRIYDVVVDALAETSRSALAYGGAF
jgi:hypothetical protein